MNIRAAGISSVAALSIAAAAAATVTPAEAGSKGYKAPPRVHKTYHPPKVHHPRVHHHRHFKGHHHRHFRVDRHFRGGSQSLFKGANIIGTIFPFVEGLASGRYHSRCGDAAVFGDLITTLGHAGLAKATGGMNIFAQTGVSMVGGHLLGSLGESMVADCERQYRRGYRPVEFEWVDGQPVRKTAVVVKREVTKRPPVVAKVVVHERAPEIEGEDHSAVLAAAIHAVGGLLAVEQSTRFESHFVKVGHHHYRVRHSHKHGHHIRIGRHICKVERGGNGHHYVRHGGRLHKTVHRPHHRPHHHVSHHPHKGGHTVHPHKGHRHVSHPGYGRQVVHKRGAHRYVAPPHIRSGVHRAVRGGSWFSRSGFGRFFSHRPTGGSWMRHVTPRRFGRH